MSAQLDIEAIQRVLNSNTNVTFVEPKNHGERVQTLILCDIAQSLRRIAHILEERSK
jgi:hypothetical protein